MTDPQEEQFKELNEWAAKWLGITKRTHVSATGVSRDYWDSPSQGLFYMEPPSFVERIEYADLLLDRLAVLGQNPCLVSQPDQKLNVPIWALMCKNNPNQPQWCNSKPLAICLGAHLCAMLAEAEKQKSPPKEEGPEYEI